MPDLNYITIANDIHSFASHAIDCNRAILADLNQSDFNFVTPKLIEASQWYIIINIESINDKINLLLPQISNLRFSSYSQFDRNYFSTIYNMYIENANNLWQIRNDRIITWRFFNEHYDSVGQPVRSYVNSLENQYKVNKFKIDYFKSSIRLIDSLNDTLNINCKLGVHNSYNIVQDEFKID